MVILHYCILEIYVLNENYACKSQYIRNKHIYKYIKQKRIKSQLVNLSESVPNIIIHDLMELFITHDESSPPVPFHLAASKVIIVSIVTDGWIRTPHNIPSWPEELALAYQLSNSWTGKMTNWIFTGHQCGQFSYSTWYLWI